MSRNTVSLCCATVTILACFIATSASAETQWAKDHPNRHQVNSRLNNQDQRIKQEEKTGQINSGQAKGLHAQDHAIRTEERADAATHGGHITRAQQKQLDHQENGVSKEIGK